jgi:hypothetical protein
VLLEKELPLVPNVVLKNQSLVVVVTLETMWKLSTLSLWILSLSKTGTTSNEVKINQKYLSNCFLSILLLIFFDTDRGKIQASIICQHAYLNANVNLIDSRVGPSYQVPANCISLSLSLLMHKNPLSKRVNYILPHISISVQIMQKESPSQPNKKNDNRK